MPTLFDLDTLKRALRYGVTGVGVNALAFGVFAAVVHAGVNSYAAVVASYLSALLTGYVVNRKWSFESRRSHRQALPRYLALYAGILAFHLGLFHLQTRMLGVGEHLAMAIGIVASAAIVFLVLNFSIFRQAS